MKEVQATYEMRCSFCGKRREMGRHLVAGPGVSICNECVKLCNEILSNPPPSQDDACSTSRSLARRGSGWWRHLLSRKHNAIHTY